MTTETKVEAVAWAVAVNGKPDFADIRKWECEREAAILGDIPETISIEPLYPQSALDALRGEVADRDAVIECKNIDIRERDRSLHEWAERAKAAERRVAELVGIIDRVDRCSYAVSTEIDSRGHRWSEAYLDQVLPELRAALTKESP